jgi:hypothetical protein
VLEHGDTWGDQPSDAPCGRRRASGQAAVAVHSFSNQVSRIWLGPQLTSGWSSGSSPAAGSRGQPRQRVWESLDGGQRHLRHPHSSHRPSVGSGPRRRMTPGHSDGTASERLTSPLTVRSDLRKRRLTQRWAATYSHGGGHLGPSGDPVESTGSCPKPAVSATTFLPRSQGPYGRPEPVSEINVAQPALSDGCETVPR